MYGAKAWVLGISEQGRSSPCRELREESLAFVLSIKKIQCHRRKLVLKRQFHPDQGMFAGGIVALF